MRKNRATISNRERQTLETYGFRVDSAKHRNRRERDLALKRLQRESRETANA